ncbi:MAG: helix-turn-helix domain-containing protein [Blautia sp.]|nr:helix-turn-helix domain-containing protein [Blautia sp.]
MDIGERMKEIRKEKGLSQADVARDMMSSQSYISGVERGREMPTPRFVKLYCLQYGISENELMNGNGSGSAMPEGSPAPGDDRPMGKKDGTMEAFDSCVHFPATAGDRHRIENALWEGWELMVDRDTNEVWIGDREELIAKIGGRKD